MQELVLGAVIFHQSTVITLWLLTFIWKLYPASDSCVRAMEGAKQSCSTADDQTACVQNTVTTLNECNKHLPFSAGTSNETLCSSMNTVEKNLKNGLLTGCKKWHKPYLTMQYFLVDCRWACLPSWCHANSKLYCGPNGLPASIFYGIWITQTGAMVFILNLDKETLSYDEHLKS